MNDAFYISLIGKDIDFLLSQQQICVKYKIGDKLIRVRKKRHAVYVCHVCTQLSHDSNGERVASAELVTALSSYVSHNSTPNLKMHIPF